MKGTKHGKKIEPLYKVKSQKKVITFLSLGLDKKYHSYWLCTHKNYIWSPYKHYFGVL